ncbi:hypothetical protein HYH02_009269 [Chlamydomonas schloesseri]|uniref:Dephospho-CoA kinase n=1 Tax=Chlamydomonas schloesseri TaxID=2026947 RepID=A0A835TG88_9CHLO|nr:hypothetical protein HYH02_009269 [Chlamydomonas schloesseri]|eukprot:KAG2443192.1 hypothetical protein HYH02_009269 [Chlamydomonas schloesseri]
MATREGAAPAQITFVLGLTGSIGMGKSTVSNMLKEEGVPVWDADATVHKLYSAGGAAVPLVEAAFPGVTVGGAIDRAALSKYVVGNEAAMKQLEGIVHPLVAADRADFLAQVRASGQPLAVLDIPLLYETGGPDRHGCDAVAVVSAAPDLQRARVLARPGMSEEKLAAILSRQVPDEEKRKRADYVIDTGVEVADTRRHVGQLVAELRRKGGAN